MIMKETEGNPTQRILRYVVPDCFVVLSKRQHLFGTKQMDNMRNVYYCSSLKQITRCLIYGKEADRVKRIAIFNLFFKMEKQHKIDTCL